MQVLMKFVWTFLHTGPDLPESPRNRLFITPYEIFVTILGKSLIVQQPQMVSNLRKTERNVLVAHQDTGRNNQSYG